MRTHAVAALVTLVLAAPGCRSTQPQEAEDVYREGQAKAQSDTPGAIKLLEGGLASYPNFHRMRFALARLQYETGEVHHRATLDARRVQRKLEDEGKPTDAQKAAREAAESHQRAFPFYRAARENLHVVADKDGDVARRAWAYELLVKCDVFFEDFEPAAEHLEKAIDLGRPTGQQLAAWEELLASLKREVGKRRKAG